MGWFSDLWRLPDNAGVERLPDPPEQARSEVPPEQLGPQVAPPPRPPANYGGNVNRSLSLIPVYRAVSIIASSVSSLTLDVWRGSTPVPSPTWVRQPDIKTTRSAFFEATTTSLATNGNAFWRVVRDSPGDAPSALLILDPLKVSVHEDGTFGYEGKKLRPWQVRHLQLLRIPGRPRGLGPIQAAAADLNGIADIRDYSSNWFDSGTVPNGTLSTDKPITADEAKRLKTQFVDSVNGGEPAVLGYGLSYSALSLSPKDAQFLEVRQFSTTDIARLFGIPAHLMLSVVEGGAMTYLSGEAADLQFTRFTLTQYLREIEEAVTALLPRNNTARFNLDAVLRPATKDRYEAHKIALEAGFLTLQEVRDIEGLPPLPAEENHP